MASEVEDDEISVTSLVANSENGTAQLLRARVQQHRSSEAELTQLFAQQVGIVLRAFQRIRIPFVVVNSDTESELLSRLEQTPHRRCSHGGRTRLREDASWHTACELLHGAKKDTHGGLLRAENKREERVGAIPMRDLATAAESRTPQPVTR